MELRDYMRTIRKGWIFIASAIVIGLAAGVLSTVVTQPKYDSSTDLFVSVRASDEANAGDLVEGSSAAQQKVQSYVHVVTSTKVLDPVIRKLRLATTPAALARKITAESPTDTVLITVSVRDTDARRAADIADAVSVSFADVVENQLEAPGSGKSSLVKITTLKPATVATTPASPRLLFNLGLGLVIGLALGIAAAVLRQVLDIRVRNAEDIQQITAVPVIGGINLDPRAQKNPLIMHVDPRNPRAESYRGMRTNLQFLNSGSESRCFVITSSLPQEGKTVTASNLAIAIAENGMTVALVDGDLRLPRIAETMGLEGGAGLTDVLIGRAALEDVLQPWGSGTLYVLASGRIPPNPSELLGSEAMSTVIERLTASFDYVLIDSPPLLPVTDAAILGKSAAGVIVVAAAGKVSRNELQSALQRLSDIKARIVGVALTMLPTKGPDSYGYGRYDTYGEAVRVARPATPNSFPNASKAQPKPGWAP